MLCWAPTAWVSVGSCLLIGVPGALIPAMVFAILAEVQGKHRDVAFAESSAVSYAFAIMGPLAMSLCLSLGLGWRGAVMLGVVIGAAVLLLFRSVPIDNSTELPTGGTNNLPASYWTYWCMLASVVALEYSVLFWAPAFLQRVANLSPAQAAGSAGAFSVAMIVGRVVEAL